MMNFTKTTLFSAALMMAVTSAGFAQSTDAPADDDTQTSTVQDQLSLGEDASQDAELGRPYTREEVGDWEIRCIKSEAEDPCQLYQLLDDGEGIPVAEISLFRLPEGGKAIAGATIIVPLETALPPQLTISVDGGSARRYPYAFCNPIGCYARVGLTAGDVATFKKGSLARITIIPALAPDQPVVLDLSLKGFTAGFDLASVIDE